MSNVALESDLDSVPPLSSAPQTIDSTAPSVDGADSNPVAAALSSASRGNSPISEGAIATPSTPPGDTEGIIDDNHASQVTGAAATLTYAAAAIGAEQRVAPLLQTAEEATVDVATPQSPAASAHDNQRMVSPVQPAPVPPPPPRAATPTPPSVIPRVVLPAPAGGPQPPQQLFWSLHLMRLQLIETAEDAQVWSTRARRQWGNGNVVALRVSIGTHIIGLTPPQAFDFAALSGGMSADGRHRGFSGLDWSSGGGGASSSKGGAVVAAVGSGGGGISFDLPQVSPSNGVIMLEVLNFGSLPPTLSGISVINASSFVSQASSNPAAFTARRPFLSQRYAVHCFPNLSVSLRDNKDATTHAVIVAELRVTSAAAAAANLEALGGGAGTGVPSHSFVANGSFSGGFSRNDSVSSNMSDASVVARQASSTVGRALLANGTPSMTAVSGTPAAMGQHHQALSPLDFNFGVVRLSSVKLFFPTSFLTSCGEYIVSNVVCAMNNTENDVLTMQMVVKNRGGERRNASIDASTLLVVHPKEPVSVRPQQRAFFSVTWGVGRPPMGIQSLQESVLVQLVVLGGGAATAGPIELDVQCTEPQPDGNAGQHHPFHYWINTTMVSNRPLSEEVELPYVRSVLPVFLLLQQASTTSASSSGGSGGGGAAVAPSGGSGGGEDGSGESIVVRDRDRGGLMVVHSGGGAAGQLVVSSSSFSSAPSVATAGVGNKGGYALDGTMTAASTRPLAMWQIALRSPRLMERVDMTQPRRIRCVIHMGYLRGLPMVLTSSSSNLLGGLSAGFNGSTNGFNNNNGSVTSPRGDGDTDLGTTTNISHSLTQNSAPAFRVSLSVLQPGWSITRGETTPSYQTQSGGLNWVGDSLEVVKQPNASVVQCLRLDLNEVNLADDDEIPIGSAIVSLSPAPLLPSVMRLPVAFYVFDSYSLYDKLSSTSLLFKDVALEILPN